MMLFVQINIDFITLCKQSCQPECANNLFLKWELVSEKLMAMSGDGGDCNQLLTSKELFTNVFMV